MNYKTLSTLLADAAYTNLSAPDAATALNAATVALPDNTLYTWRAIARVCGLPVAVTLKAAMEAALATMPEYQLALDMLGQYADGAGVSFADPQVAAMVEAFAAAGILTADQATALKGLGVSKVSPATNAGLGTVSQEDVLLARAAAQVAAAGIAATLREELAKASWTALTTTQVLTLANADWPGVATATMGRTVTEYDVFSARAAT